MWYAACITNGAETPLQKKVVKQKERCIPLADGISETISEMLHPFPLSCFRKDVYDKILCSLSIVAVIAIEIMSLHLSKRKLRAYLT